MNKHKLVLFISLKHWRRERNGEIEKVRERETATQVYGGLYIMMRVYCVTQ